MRTVLMRVLLPAAAIVGICATHSTVAIAAEARLSDRGNVAAGIIVKWRAEPNTATLNSRVAAADQIARSRSLSLIYGRMGALNTHVLRLDRARPAEEVESLAKEIAGRDPAIEYAEADVIMQPLFTPNDTFYSFQWHFYEPTAGVNLPAAWDISTGAGVRVAVLDTGYRPHADLAANILPGYDFISDIASANDGGGRDADALDPGNYSFGGNCGAQNSSWHGTMVSGVIAAVTNNATGVAGAAHNSSIVPVRVLGVCGGTTSDIADAIVWASGGTVAGVPANLYPAQILNLSFGALVPSCGSTYQNAINSARSRNSIVIVAAGNDSTLSHFARPANCDGVLSVAAVDRAGDRANYSNFGEKIDLAAPGGEVSVTYDNGVFSTSNSGTHGPSSDSYVSREGTSLAAPHVAAVAALVLSQNAAIPPAALEAYLESTARPFPGSCSDCGSGIVDASAAVAGVGTLVHTTSMVQGTGGSGNDGYKAGSYGSLGSTVMGSGEVIQEFRDQAFVGYVKISGFSSNPGKSWLVSATARGDTRTGSSAFGYSYSGGTATWQWDDWGFATSGSTPITLVHK